MLSSALVICTAKTVDLLKSSASKQQISNIHFNFCRFSPFSINQVNNNPQSPKKKIQQKRDSNFWGISHQSMLKKNTKDESSSFSSSQVARRSDQQLR